MKGVLYIGAHSTERVVCAGACFKEPSTSVATIHHVQRFIGSAARYSSGMPDWNGPVEGRVFGSVALPGCPQ